MLVQGGAGVRQPPLAPCLSGVLVLGGSELACSLCLLLQALLLLGVGEADLDLEVLALGLDVRVVERLDDLIAGIATLEAMKRCQSVSASR